MFAAREHRAEWRALKARDMPATRPEPKPTVPDRLLKKRVVLHLDTDQSLQGVLMEMEDREAGWSILRAAKLLSDDSDKPDVVLAGETFVPHSRVVFAQLDE